MTNLFQLKYLLLIGFNKKLLKQLFTKMIKKLNKTGNYPKINLNWKFRV